MEYINVNLPDGTLLSLECNYDGEKRICTLSQDVEINGWTIRKDINVGGPKTSQYKYCFDNFVEILLTDKNGKKDFIRHFYNLNVPGVIVGDDKEATAVNCGDNLVVSAISHFLNKAAVLKCEDWEDYNAYKILSQIKQCIHDKVSNIEKLQTILHLIGK